MSVKAYSHIKRLSTGELEIIIRLLKARLDAGTITYPESRFLLRAVATKSAAGDKAAIRIRQTVHRVAKKQNEASVAVH